MGSVVPGLFSTDPNLWNLFSMIFVPVADIKNGCCHFYETVSGRPELNYEYLSA